MSVVADSFDIPAKNGSFELIEKRSRFLAEAIRVSSRDDVAIELANLRALHPKANHVCYAFVAGAPGDAQNWGFSDDGEPSGTAGKPILGVLQHSGLGGILVAVIRYFGGTKLGTGGLVRAYTSAAKVVIESLPRERFERKSRLLLASDFAHETMVRKIISQVGGDVSSCEYGENVLVETWLTDAQATMVATHLQEGWFRLVISEPG